MKPLLLLAALLAVFSADFQLPAQASPAGAELTAARSRVRDETMDSVALGTRMTYRVLLPERYDGTLERYAVLHLLHGLGGSYTDWTTRTNIAEYSRTLPLLIVMPDAANGWYVNAADGSGRYEDYVFNELPADVVKKFRTINSRHGRAVAGLSMGGYGALKTALARPATFAVAASFSGAFNVTREGELEKLIGGEEAQRLQRIFGPAGGDTRKQNDVFALASALKPSAVPYVYIDCGIADNALIGANRDLVAALHKAGVAYEYHEVAGAHSWDYWDRRIREFLPILMKRLAN